MDQLTFTEYRSDLITRINVGKVRPAKPQMCFMRSSFPFLSPQRVVLLWLGSEKLHVLSLKYLFWSLQSVLRCPLEISRSVRLISVGTQTRWSVHQRHEHQVMNVS